MPRNAGALSRLTSADPVPEGGRDLVRYMGGRQAATRALTGLAASPKRADYKSADKYEADRRAWRSASRRVQRWDAEGGRQQRSPTLDATERRRAQRVNRQRKVDDVRKRGLYARIHATFTIGSPGGRTDSRERTIPRGGPGALLENGDDVLDALQEGDRDEAAALVLAEFLAEMGLPEYTEVEESRVKVWPVGEAEPTW